jgi:hypothetical protein
MGDRPVRALVMPKWLETMARLSTVTSAVLLALYWAYFALDSLPWIVPADHSSEYVWAYERASAAGFALAIVSVVSSLLAAGVFGRLWGAVGTALVLLVVIVAAVPPLYPAIAYMQLSPLRIPAQVAGVVVVLVGTVLSIWRPKSASTQGPDSAQPPRSCESSRRLPPAGSTDAGPAGSSKSGKCG